MRTRPRLWTIALVFTALVIAGATSALAWRITHKPTTHIVTSPCLRHTKECGKPPRPPADMSYQTAAGVRATIRHHYALINYTQRTGDYGPLNDIYTAVCRQCAAIVDNFVHIATAHRYIDGGEYSVTETSDVTITAITASIDVSIAREPATLHNIDGQKIDETTVDGEDTTLRRFTLTYIDNTWKIIAIDAKENQS